MPGEVKDSYRALHAALPEALFSPGFTRRLSETLGQTLELDLDLWLHSIQLLRRTQLRAILPGQACIMVVGLPPLEHKLLVEVDLAFAYRAVDQLLGGYAPAVDTQRPLTDIEQGVLSYLLLKGLSQLSGELAAESQVAVRLEDLRADLKSCADILRKDALWVVVSWKMNFDLDVGYIRALIPLSLAGQLLPQAPPPPDSAAAARLRAHKRARMHRLYGVQAEAAIQIGHIELRPEDLNALDPGDIVLMDEVSADLSEGEVGGEARLVLGQGENATVHGSLGVQEDELGRHLIFQVGAIEAHPAPRSHNPVQLSGLPENPEDAMAALSAVHEQDSDGSPHPLDILEEDRGHSDEDMAEDEEYYDDGSYEGEEPDNLVEAEALLGDIPVHVSVEIGRVQLSADEVIQLRAGHLIELGRAPSDPVDLVVGGKLLARGELVEIEGSLGVRLLNLAKESPQ